MPWCPKCKRFQDEDDLCIHCWVETVEQLEPDLPKKEKSGYIQLESGVLLKRVTDESEAMVIQSVLGANQIDSILIHRPGGSNLYLGITSNLGIDILVSESDLEKAQEILDADSITTEDEKNIDSPGKEKHNEPESTLVEILFGAWFFFKNNLLSIFIISLIFFIPADFFGMLLFDKRSSFTIYMLLDILVNTMLTLIATMAIAVIVEQHMLQANIGYKDAIKISLSKLAAGIKTDFLAFLIIGFGLLLLIIPGLYLLTIYFFSRQVVVLRNLSWMAALDYSADLVKGRWWKVFALNILFGIINLITFYSVEILLKYSLEPYLRRLISEAIGIFFTAFFCIAATFLFLNLDYRKNGKPINDGNNIA